MHVRPTPGVIATVLDDGRLELVDARTASVRLYDRADAAMWIALLQNDGDSVTAADMLADLWDVSRENMRADLMLWAEEMCDVGLLQVR